MKQHIFIITGPTASGKSDVALYVASQIDKTEIISADSMQVYRKMDIGTAKVPISIRSTIPHYMIDVVEPWESYNLGKYVRDVKSIVSTKKNQDNLLLIVGGTGLYINGLLSGVFEGPEADWQFRDQLRSIADKMGQNYLHDLLKKVDHVSANRLHPRDHKRIIRALEVYEKTGKTISELQKQYLNKEPEFSYSIFVIDRPREDICNRIESRIETMFKHGLLDEVRDLKENPNGLSKQAKQALGYRETLSYLNNEITLQQTKELIKQNTKKFAKRQITWFKSFRNTFWINTTSTDNNEITGNKVLDMIKSINYMEG